MAEQMFVEQTGLRWLAAAAAVAVVVVAVVAAFFVAEGVLAAVAFS